jgi:oligosaccharyltransferase complex subunit alpha (ribophorin I)
LAPYSELYIHFRDNAPLPIFPEVKRQIEVSHWGNIAIDEEYSMNNDAGEIKGEFGRVDYQEWNPNIARYTIKSLSSSLPRRAKGLYYIDQLGNVTTSNARRDVRFEN